MAVEVGDLYLAITAPGAPEATKALKQVDAAATATGKSFTQAMASAEKATQKATASVTRLAQSMAAGASSRPSSTAAGLAGLARAQTAVAAQGTAAAGATGLLAGGLTRLMPIGLAVAFGVGTLAKKMFEYGKAADEARAATNKLRGAAIDSGQSFAAVKLQADAARLAYGLTRDEAAKLISATARLDAETDGAARSQQMLAAAMNTARARGLSNAEAIDLVEAAVKGNAEAVRQLTGMRPDELYAKWAAKNGVAAESLNDVGRQQAFASAAIAEGARRAGEAATATDTLTAAQRNSERATNDLKVAFGNLLAPLRTFLNEAQAGFADFIARSITAGTMLKNIAAIASRSFAFDFGGAKPEKGKAVDPVSVSSLLQFVGGTSFRALKIKEAKEEKDTTDQLIASLVTLFEARKADASQIARSIALYDKEKKILDDTTQSLERRAKAYERTQQLEKAGVVNIKRSDIVPIKEGRPALDPTKPEFAQEFNVAEIQRSADDLWTEYTLAFEAAGNRATAASATALAEYQRLTFESVAESGTRAMQEEFVVAFASLPMQLHNAMRAGFIGGVTEFQSSIGGIFSNLGAAISTKGADAVLAGLGGFFKKVGLSIGIFGKLMAGLQKAIAAHPLLAGAAAIAVGIALTKLGNSIGGAASGGAGSFAGGTIGGLGIGSTTQGSQTYSFAAGTRPGVNGFNAGRKPVEGQAIIVQFNGPIIGPNDVQAQSAIAAVVNNAARRGLIR